MASIFINEFVNNNFIRNSNTVIVGTKIGKNEILKFTNFKKKNINFTTPGF